MSLSAHGQTAIPCQIDQLLLFLIILVHLIADILDETVDVNRDGLLQLAFALGCSRLDLLLLSEAEHFLYTAILGNPLLSFRVVDLLNAETLQRYVHLRYHAVMVASR